MQIQWREGMHKHHFFSICETYRKLWTGKNFGFIYTQFTLVLIMLPVLPTYLENRFFFHFLIIYQKAKLTKRHKGNTMKYYLLSVIKDETSPIVPPPPRTQTLSSPFSTPCTDFRACRCQYKWPYLKMLWM